MKNRVAASIVTSLALLHMPSMACAQTSGGTPASPISAADTAGSVLRVGTEVPLKLSETLTTKGKMLHINQRFHMETAADIFVQGVAVVPAGSPAIGEITEVRNKGMWGKSGHFTARILYVTVNGRQIRLSGAFDDKGVAGGIGAAAVSAIVFLPAGFFMTGTSAQLPAGTAVKGFIDEDVPLSIAAAAVAPLSVSAPTELTSTNSPPTPMVAAPK